MWKFLNLRGNIKQEYTFLYVLLIKGHLVSFYWGTYYFKNGLPLIPVPLIPVYL